MLDRSVRSSASDRCKVLQPVQHTGSRTWRLDAGGKFFLVKELWPDGDPFRVTRTAYPMMFNCAMCELEPKAMIRFSSEDRP